MDDHLSMASQVSNICRSAYYHLSRIAKIRHSLTTSVCKSLIHGLVTSRLDYGNAMLFLIWHSRSTPSPPGNGSAARVVMQIRRDDRQSMTTILQHLHWLPVKKRIEFKILVLVHKAIYEGQTVYLASLLNQHTPKRCLRSSICGCNIPLQPTVRDIPVFLDSGLAVLAQVSRMCQSAYFQLHNIAKIRHCLTINACKTIVRALVTSKLDYGNAVLFGINGRLINKLQQTAKFGNAFGNVTAAPRPHHAGSDCTALATNQISHYVQSACVDVSRSLQSSAQVYITDLISA